MDERIQNLLLQHLEAATGASVKINNMKTLSGGCINHASHLFTSEGDFFVKWNANGPKDLFLREAECLEELGKASTTLKIPRVFAKTEIQGGEPGLLITDFLLPPTESGTRQDEVLGRGLAELHKFRSEKYGFFHDNYCGATPQDNRWNFDWVDFFGHQRVGHLIKLIQKNRELGKKESQIYEKLIERLPELIGHQPTPALNHGDLWSGNYMYSSEGPALIDPASYYADREFDLAMMRMFGGFSARVWSTYQEAFPLPPEWEERSDLYMLYHVLNHYYLFGGHYGRQAVAIAEKYL